MWLRIQLNGSCNEPSGSIKHRFKKIRGFSCVILVSLVMKFNRNPRDGLTEIALQTAQRHERQKGYYAVRLGNKVSTILSYVSDVWVDNWIY
jgi:hypothetical protein